MKWKCLACRQVFFESDADPMDWYLAGRGGWGGEPLVVYMGYFWKTLWSRKWFTLWTPRQWYHQNCVGIYLDEQGDRGEYRIFGYTPLEKQNHDRPVSDLLPDAPIWFRTRPSTRVKS